MEFSIGLFLKLFRLQLEYFDCPSNLPNFDLNILWEILAIFLELFRFREVCLVKFFVVQLTN